MSDQYTPAVRTCSLCGKSNFWVGWVASISQFRCVNHIAVSKSQEATRD